MTSVHIKIKIKMQNPSQKPQAPIKAPNQDLNDIDVLCTFEIKIESQNSEYRCIKNPHHIQVKIKTSNPNQEPPAPNKAPDQDLKHMDVLCTFKIEIKIQNLNQIFSR